MHRRPRHRQGVHHLSVGDDAGHHRDADLSRHTRASQGGILTYSGTVSNAGNITLTNIVVVNNQPAANTVIFTAASLAPGATANFTGSYQVPSTAV